MYLHRSADNMHYMLFEEVTMLLQCKWRVQTTKSRACPLGLTVLVVEGAEWAQRGKPTRGCAKLSLGLPDGLLVQGRRRPLA